MNSKYVLTDETLVHQGVELHRIKALVDVPATDDAPGVNQGDLGGWVETESNLSAEGNSWVYEGAKVTGNAVVSGDARIVGPMSSVTDHAQVSGSSYIEGSVQISGSATVSGSSRITGMAHLAGYTNVRDVLLKGNVVIEEPSLIFTLTGQPRYYVIRSVWGGGFYITYCSDTGRWYYDGFAGTGDELIENTRFNFGTVAQECCSLIVTTVKKMEASRYE